MTVKRRGTGEGLESNQNLLEKGVDVLPGAAPKSAPKCGFFVLYFNRILILFPLLLFF